MTAVHLSLQKQDMLIARSWINITESKVKNEKQPHDSLIIILTSGI